MSTDKYKTTLSYKATLRYKTTLLLKFATSHRLTHFISSKTTHEEAIANHRRKILEKVNRQQVTSLSMSLLR